MPMQGRKQGKDLQGSSGVPGLWRKNGLLKPKGMPIYPQAAKRAEPRTLSRKRAWKRATFWEGVSDTPITEFRRALLKPPRTSV